MYAGIAGIGYDNVAGWRNGNAHGSVKLAVPAALVPKREGAKENAQRGLFVVSWADANLGTVDAATNRTKVRLLRLMVSIEWLPMPNDLPFSRERRG